MNRIRPMFTRPFIRHYVEMVVAMYAGMFLLGWPLEILAGGAGIDTANWDETAPAVVLLNMAIVMTVPMVAWMRWRHGHGWRPCIEMAASMFLPTFAAIGLMATGVVEDFMTLMVIEHIAMFPAMLIAMLIRPEEYGCAHHHAHGDAVTPAEVTA